MHKMNIKIHEGSKDSLISLYDDLVDGLDNCLYSLKDMNDLRVELSCLEQGKSSPYRRSPKTIKAIIQGKRDGLYETFNDLLKKLDAYL